MNVLIIDDDKLITYSLKTILESDCSIHVVAIGNNGLEAIQLYKQYVPDILLMDIRMKPMSGLDAASHILSDDKDAKILFLTTFSDDEYIIKALSLGAKGYILKQDFESLIPALKAVEIGQNVYGNDIISKLPSYLTSIKKHSLSDYGLTEKEQEIIEKVAEGLNNKEISELLFLSEGTIRNYLSSILEKLELRDRTQLAIFYLNCTP